MKPIDYSRPGWFARWGWTFATWPVLGAIPNILGMFVDPEPWRYALLLITVVATALCLRIWRKGVRDDMEHRALMRQMTSRRWTA